MPNIGPLELIVVLVVVLLIFGPKRLPGLGRQLGGGMREFKDSLTGSSKEDDHDEDADAERRPALTAAEPTDRPAARSTTTDADATERAERH
ncbi:MAG: sec-independent protein translocase protein TatA [Solirubrobacteraceae bacterium]|jgi:sec-independent protein translocase protein TatA|nr:sec-independent protein translocase protein TatA [Solirubrobacteraceae bacterium]